MAQTGLGMPDVEGGSAFIRQSAERCRMQGTGGRDGLVFKNEFVEVSTVRQATAKIALDACGVVRRFGIFK